MRCMALAKIARDRDISVHITGRIGVDWVKERLKNEGISFSELAGLVPERENPQELLANFKAIKKTDWVILDGYHFGLDCQQAMRAAGYKLLVIDDYTHLPEYSCDILLNQNIGAEEFVYTGDIAQKLLGPKYALLRPEFLAACSQVKEQQLLEKANNILLTLGGGDCSEHLALIAPLFANPNLKGCTLRIIAGAMPIDYVNKLFTNCPANVEVLNRVDNMPALLLNTDLCVTAGGSICLELCYLGVPFLIVKVAENQHFAINEWIKHQITRLLSADSLKTVMNRQDIRIAMAETGRKIVDGKGAQRIINCVFCQDT